MYDPTILCARPGCGKRLTKRQRYNHSRYCSIVCAAAMRPQTAKRRQTCAYCDGALTKNQVHNRRTYCSLSCAQRARTHRNTPPRATNATETNPGAVQDSGMGTADLTPQRGSCGSVLWTEGRTTYTVGDLNGVAVVYDGPGRVYCALGAWPDSAAGRRARMPKAQPVVLFETWPAYGRSYPQEVEG